MDTLLGLLILVMATILQSALIRQLTLLHGSADLVLVVLVLWAVRAPSASAWRWALIGGLLVGWVSALPWVVPLAGYLLAVGLAQVVARRLWTLAGLASLLAVFLGSLITQALTWGVLQLQGIALPVGQTVDQVVLPSLLLNLALVLLLYGWLADLAAWMFPVELEV